MEEEMADNRRIELGDRVKDRVTKRVGIVVSITDWLYGCRRIQIEPEKSKDGKFEHFVIDEPQAELVKKHVIAGRHYTLSPITAPHGGRPDAVRAPDPSR
jgi:hypothetical protein